MYRVGDDPTSAEDDDDHRFTHFIYSNLIFARRFCVNFTHSIRRHLVCSFIVLIRIHTSQKLICVSVSVLLCTCSTYTTCVLYTMVRFRMQDILKEYTTYEMCYAEKRKWNEKRKHFISSFGCYCLALSMMLCIHHSLSAFCVYIVQVSTLHTLDARTSIGRYMVDEIRSIY